MRSSVIARVTDVVSSVAVLSDVHGVLPVLDAVLAEPDVAAADLVVVTGDHASGPQPVEVLDRLVGLGDRCVLVRGNADRELVDIVRGGTSDHPESMCPIATLSWLSVIIGIALVPGVIATGMAALPKAPRLATVALLVVVPGWGVALVAPSIDMVAHAAFATGVPEPDAVRMLGYFVDFTMRSPL